MMLSLRSYAKYFVLFSVLFIVLGVGLSYLNLNMPSGLGTILPPMFAAQMLGMRHGQRVGQPLAKGEAWRLAVPMTACALAIQLGMFAVWAVLMIAGGVDLMSTFAAVGLPTLMILLLVMVAIVYLVNRTFLGFGVRNGIKAAQGKTSGS